MTTPEDAGSTANRGQATAGEFESEIPEEPAARRKKLLIAIGVGTAVGIAIVVASLIVAGIVWSGSPAKKTDSPEKAMLLYMEAVKDSDTEAAGKVMCRKLTGGKGLKVNTEYQFKKLDYRLTDSRRISDTEYRVTIDVDALVAYQGKDSTRNGMEIYKVVKEDGKWKMCGNTKEA